MAILLFNNLISVAELCKSFNKKFSILRKLSIRKYRKIAEDLTVKYFDKNMIITYDLIQGVIDFIKSSDKLSEIYGGLLSEEEISNFMIRGIDINNLHITLIRGSIIRIEYSKDKPVKEYIMTILKASTPHNDLLDADLNDEIRDFVKEVINVFIEKEIKYYERLHN